MGIERRELAVLVLGLCSSLAGCGSANPTEVSEDKPQTSSGGGGGSGGSTEGAVSNGNGTTNSSGGGGGAGPGGSGGASSNATTGGTVTHGSTGDSGGAGSTATSTNGGEALACPGFEPRPDVPGTTCRSPDDCDNGGACDPNPYSGCGFCSSPRRECENNDDCGEGALCVEFELTDTCACSFELATECRPSCTETSCGAGYECVDEICLPLTCAQGFACAAASVCAPDRQGSDARGCAPPNCNEGRACEAGYTCDSQTGECSALHCSEGGAAACPENSECDTDTLGRGCVNKACDVDADCDCGVCIHNCTGAACPRGQCAGRLYVCNLPVG